jgi:hypothetical protein
MLFADSFLSLAAGHTFFDGSGGCLTEHAVTYILSKKRLFCKPFLLLRRPSVQR